MGVRHPTQPSRGFCAVGVWHPKTESNIGTLWRTAHSMGAAMLFTVGRRYRYQSTDTTHAWMHTPLLHFTDLEDLVDHLPHSSPLVGVELAAEAHQLSRYSHLRQATYLLGAEDHGLPGQVQDRCHSLVQVDTANDLCLNVAVAGALVMWHRYIQHSQDRRPLRQI